MYMLVWLSQEYRYMPLLVTDSMAVAEAWRAAFIKRLPEIPRRDAQGNICTLDPANPVDKLLLLTGRGVNGLYVGEVTFAIAPIAALNEGPEE